MTNNLYCRVTHAACVNNVHIIEDMLRNAAIEISPDYPGIKDANTEPWEHLYALKCAYLGTRGANQDLHAFIKWLCIEKLNTQPLDIIRDWDEWKQAASDGGGDGE